MGTAGAETAAAMAAAATTAAAERTRHPKTWSIGAELPGPRGRYRKPLEEYRGFDGEAPLQRRLSGFEPEAGMTAGGSIAVNPPLPVKKERLAGGS